MSTIHIVIPARFGSSRLPGKLMLDLVGKPVIVHAVERALTLTDSVYVATDNQEIFDVVSQAGATALMTSDKHNSGTDRLAEAALKLNFADDDVVVNLQGDEPLMPIQLLEQVSALLTSHRQAGVATLMQRIKHVRDLINPNVVKVAKGESCKALYFSRAPIPYPRDEFSDQMGELPQGDYFRHIGLYAYRVKTLKAITQLPEHPLESLEKLEQLRPLAHGIEIVIDEAITEPEHGIDTLKDLERVRALLSSK